MDLETLEEIRVIRIEELEILDFNIDQSNLKLLVSYTGGLLYIYDLFLSKLISKLKFNDNI